ncbi:MAG: hypothetical protein FWC10_07000 [Lentimicrobiaceae bacterium]|nr:hypothetical protein [Lentimicrobiaceae bacterium]
MPIQDKWKIVLNTTILFLGIAFLLVFSNSKCCKSKWHHDFHCSKDYTYTFKNDDTFAHNDKNFITYEDYENAHLELVASAGKLFFSPGEELIAIHEAKNPQSKIMINSELKNNSIYIKAELQPFKKHYYNNSYQYNVLLNSTPVWEMDLELNATAGEIDLSAFKIKELDIESNASALELKLGSLYPEVNVTIESNASAVEIKIPYGMKCVLKKTDSTLSSFDVTGLKKQGGQYVSTEDNETAGVINIMIETSVSAVEVKRY